MAMVLQVATFALAGLGYWGSLQKDGEANAIAVEHRLSALESDVKGLQNRVETMSQWLRQRGK